MGISTLNYDIAKCILNTLTVILALIFLTIEVYTSNELGMYLTTEYFDKRFLAVGLYCVFIGLAFLFGGILILRTLKNSFSSFYGKYMKYLITATLLLSIP